MKTSVPQAPQSIPAEPRSWGSWTERAASYHSEQHPALARLRDAQPTSPRPA